MSKRMKMAKLTFALTSALTLASGLTLTGCATTKQVEAVNTHAAQSVLGRAEASRVPYISNTTFQVNNGFYAAQSPLDIPAPNLRERLPQTFKKDASLQRMSTTLNDVSAHISRISGYRVGLAPELMTAEGGIPEVMYKGDLEGLLDYLAGSFNLSWRWDGQKIEIFRYESKMFRVNALAGKTDTTAKLDTMSQSSATGGTTGGTTGSSGQTTNITSNFDVWDDISSSVKSSLSSGGSMTVASSTGIITVRDTPTVLRQVEAQIREFNRLYSRQVLINVEVYAVERNASDSASLNWTLAWSQAASKYGINLGSGSQSSGEGPSLSGVVNSGPFSGSRLVIQALSSLGRTTLLTSGSVSTLNGQAVPLNIAREVAYLQSSSTQLTGGSLGGQATTTLTPGVVTDGFAMNVTPRLLDDNRVMLRFSVDLASIDAIETFESPDGSQAIQLPQRSVRNFLQNVSLKSGQTLVLTGLQQAQTHASKQGPLSPSAWLFGGKQSADNLSRTIVIVATPYVTN